VDVIRALAPEDLPRIDVMGVDGRVLAFAFVVSLCTALLFGVAPALRAARPDLANELKAGGRSASSSRAKHRLRAGLVVGEIAMAMVLLVGAGLLARSFVALLSVERGYRTDRVLALTVQSWQYFPTEDARAVFVPQAIERMKAIPGVRAVGVTSSLPLAPTIGAHSATVLEPGRDAPAANQLPTIHATIATPGYFDAMAIALRRGRMFDATDDRASRPVMLVSESFARRYWRGEDPVGRRLEVTFAYKPLVREVIGVVADVRQAGLQEAPRPTLYLPYAQMPFGALTFVLRTDGEPMTIARQAQEAIWAFSASMPMSSVATLDGLVDESLRERRFHLSLLAAFSLCALVLSVVGIYGVLSQMAVERTQEIGVRMALGADGREIRSLMLGRGARLAALGVALGLAGAMTLTRLLAGMLFGVTATDPLTYAALALLVVLVAMVASYVPARRAARVDPLTALRAS
jgi:predicted permease